MIASYPLTGGEGVAKENLRDQGSKAGRSSCCPLEEVFQKKPWKAAGTLLEQGLEPWGTCLKVTSDRYSEMLVGVEMGPSGLL